MNFLRIGIDSYSANDPAELSFITSKNIKDVPVIVLSYSGTSVSIYNTLQNLKKIGAYTVFITSSNKSLACKFADTVIQLPQLRLDDLELMIASRFSINIILEQIYITVALKDFKSSIKHLRDSTLLLKELY